MNMWRYVNIFVLNVFTQSTWGVFTCVHTSGAKTVTTVALMRLISFFPALLSCSLVSPAFILRVLLFYFWHETDASSMEKNYTQSQLNIFYACQQKNMQQTDAFGLEQGSDWFYLTGKQSMHN